MSLLAEIKVGKSKKLDFMGSFISKESLIETVTAFANTAGGKFIIGIMENREICGVPDDQILELPTNISELLKVSCCPTINSEIYIENIEGKRLLIVQVFPGNSKPYFIKENGKENGTYVRIAPNNEIADSDTLVELERQNNNLGFDEEILNNCTLLNINIDSIKKDYYRYTGKELNEDKLYDMKLIKDTKGVRYVTKGLVFLSNQIGKFELTRIKCIRFKKNNLIEFIEQKEFSGTLCEQIEDTMRFVKKHISCNNSDSRSSILYAVREIIINAVVHRDYSMSSSNIKLQLFDNRIEVTSPGVLAYSMDIDDIGFGRSEFRNKAIARFFKDIKFINAYGQGIINLKNSCRNSGLIDPEFEENGKFFKAVVFNKEKEKIAMRKADILEPPKKVILIGREKIVMDYLEQNDQISNRVGIKITNMSSSGFRKLVVAMQKKDVIVAYGEGRSRVYIKK